MSTSKTITIRSHSGAPSSPLPLPVDAFGDTRMTTTGDAGALVFSAVMDRGIVAVVELVRTPAVVVATTVTIADVPARAGGSNVAV
jgi:hypothetical protein